MRTASFVNISIGTAIPSIMCKWAGFLAAFLFIYSFNDKTKNDKIKNISTNEEIERNE